jgi:hypothetical protein
MPPQAMMGRVVWGAMVWQAYNTNGKKAGLR